MSTKALGIVGLLAVVVLAGAYFMMRTPSQSDISATPASASQPQAAASAEATTTGYTLAQVATHDSQASCWTAINGKVYDVTSWISQHPGGPEHILALCGTDGSAAFNGQHGGQAQPASELATFYIAPLAQ